LTFTEEQQAVYHKHYYNYKLPLTNTYIHRKTERELLVVFYALI